MNIETTNMFSLCRNDQDNYLIIILLSIYNAYTKKPLKQCAQFYELKFALAQLMRQINCHMGDIFRIGSSPFQKFHFLTAAGGPFQSKACWRHIRFACVQKTITTRDMFVMNQTLLQNANRSRPFGKSISWLHPMLPLCQSLDWVSTGVQV